MKKKKSSKNKSTINSSKKSNGKDEHITKEIGTFHDFLVYEKEEKIKKKYYFKKFNNENPFLKDWLILESKPKTESRFTDLFKEIMEKDKKAALEDQKKLDNKEEDIQNKINLKDIKNNNNIINTNDNDNDNDNENIITNNNIFNKLQTIKEEELNDINSFRLTYNNNSFNNINNIYNINTSDYLLNNISSSYNIPYIDNNLYKHKNSIYSNTSSIFGVSTNDSDYCGSLSSMSNNNLNSFERNNSIVEKNFKLIVDIKRVIFLEDKRTTLMIKNIPNKFTGEFLLNIIDQNFKGTYNLFILPTDTNKFKNFGYAFINFTSSYFIPYFYYMFNGKMWSSTNSQKICEITYSKIQGKKGLISHYLGKIVYQNDSLRVNNEQKFIIPNEFGFIFRQAFPKQYIEEYKFYFLTKLPPKNTQ